MKILVVYYSHDGNTKFIAGRIAEAVGADVLELKPRDEKKARGFMKYLRGGKQVLGKAKPELLPLERSPEEYDLIFLGTPVWAGSYAPALRSFLEDVSPAHKTVALFCCCGAGPGRTFRNMRAALPDSRVTGEVAFVEPLKKDTDAQARKAREWAAQIVARL